MDLERTANLAETALLEGSLDQSALKMLQLDYNSDWNSDDDDMLSVVEAEIKSGGATDESDLEDGEVQEAWSSPSRLASPSTKVNPPPSTSTPVNLVKSPEKHQARSPARKKLELSPPPSPNKVCLINNIDPALVPALVLKASDEDHKPVTPARAPALAPALEPKLEHEVQAASNREAAGTETKAERPKRSCKINSYYSNNYVLSTEIDKIKFSRRSSPLSATSKQRSGKGSDLTKSPSIRPFLKPIGASKKDSKGRLNKPKVTAAEPCSVAATVTQTLMSNYLSKN